MDDLRPQNFERALLKVMPLLCRAPATDGAVESLRVLAVDGGEITPAKRDELLAKCRAGEYVEVDVSFLAYEQKPGVANRKFVRFRDGAMLKLGASGRGKPYLRDHLQEDSLARGGTIVQSSTTKRGEGDYAINIVARLTAPWAVELALRGLLSGASIGWWPTGPIECSVCGTEVYTKCYHWPGDKVTESAGSDGAKQFVRDRKGALTVEWVYTSAELIELSGCNVPAVPAAGADEVRAALAAVMPDHASGDGIFHLTAGTPVQGAASPRAQSDPQTLAPPKEPAMDLKNQPTSEPENQPDPVLSAAELERRVNERAHALLAARAANIRVVREAVVKLGVNLDQDGIEQLVDQNPDVKDAKIAVMELAAKKPGQEPIRGAHIATLGMADEADKRREAMGAVLTHRMLTLAGVPALVAAAKRKHEDITIPAALTLPTLNDEATRGMRRKRLLDMAEECLSARGIDTRNMSEREIADRALSSGSDFPLLLADVANKVLLAPFATRPSVWRQFAREMPLRDFKSAKLLRRSAAPRMKKLTGEDDEIKFGKYGERQETVELDEYAAGVEFTRKMLLNDDLGAFSAGTLGLGDSVNENRDDIVVDVITSTILTLSDGKTLIHADHNNLLASPTGTGVDAIEAAEDLMAAQFETLPGGATRKLNFDVDLWFGSRKRMVAVSKIVNPNYIPAEADNGLGSMSLRKPCLWDNRVSNTYFYGICSARTGLVFGGLEGESNPRFGSNIDFHTSGIQLKVNDDFFAGVDSHEWIVRITA